MPLLSTTSQSPTYVPGYVMVQTPYGIVPVPSSSQQPVPSKDESSGQENTAPPPPPNTNTGTNTNTNTNTGVNTDSLEFTNAIGRMINRNQAGYDDPFYSMQYGGYGAQFPNLGTQIGAALYSNIQPRQYTPAWTVDRMPPRLGMQASGQPDPTSPYLTGARRMGNYGQWFSKFDQGGGLNQPFNPFPLYAPYDPSKSLNVRAGFNPFLRNQQGTPSVGMTGAGGSYGPGLQPPPGSSPPPAAPAGIPSKGLEVGGMQPPMGGPQPGTTPGPGGYETQPGSDGVVHLLNYISQNPQLRGLLGF
jgi:hypothetical protein